MNQYLEGAKYILSIGGPSSRLKKKPMINSWTRHALCDSVLSYERNRWKFEHVIRNSMGNSMGNSMKYCRFTTVNNLFRNVNILHIKSIALTRILCVREHQVTQRVTPSWINRWLFLETWAWAACVLSCAYMHLTLYSCYFH